MTMVSNRATQLPDRPRVSRLEEDESLTQTAKHQAEVNTTGKNPRTKEDFGWSPNDTCFLFTQLGNQSQVSAIHVNQYMGNSEN